jgi:hypothetical protein
LKLAGVVGVLVAAQEVLVLLALAALVVDPEVLEVMVFW